MSVWCSPAARASNLSHSPSNRPGAFWKSIGTDLVSVEYSEGQGQPTVLKLECPGKGTIILGGVLGDLNHVSKAHECGSSER